MFWKRPTLLPSNELPCRTNGLLIKKLHKEINASPITNFSVSIDGLKGTNDLIRGIRGYFDLGLEGIKLLRGKHVAISVTLNRLSADELDKLADVAYAVGANVEFNILSRSLFFLQNADIDSMWREPGNVPQITRFLRKTLKRPGYEVDYITRYYNNDVVEEPPCVLGFLQVFVLSNGDVLTGCYPLKPVGNVLQHSLETILASDQYRRQAVAMVRRECPGCTCGIESSLAVKHAASSALFELKHLTGDILDRIAPAKPGISIEEEADELTAARLVQVQSAAADRPIRR
jgi:MoaA/NifB/PqqE/SkfB family radical SAM enzyme